jgi:hypothetical protein
MIPIHELRIGNWVTNDNSGEHYQIETGADLDKAVSRYSLIPITPELLTICGFTFQPHFKLWRKNKETTDAGPDMELNPDYWLMDFSHRNTGVEVKSLHHLQNLYFFLKGKELPVNMEVAA